MEIADKVAVITGAASGIGRSLAIELARRNVRAIAAYWAGSRPCGFNAEHVNGRPWTPVISRIRTVMSKAGGPANDGNVTSSAETYVTCIGGVPWMSPTKAIADDITGTSCVPVARPIQFAATVFAPLASRTPTSNRVIRSPLTWVGPATSLRCAPDTHATTFCHASSPSRRILAIFGLLNIRNAWRSVNAKRSVHRR